MAVDYRNCFLCRVMRALAFSGMGAAAGGYGALWLGADLNQAIMSAFFGALFLVVVTQAKKSRG